MNHNLTTPCDQCPFRKKSPRGWLGPWTPELIVEQVLAGDVRFGCHKTVTDDGVDDGKVEQCAGASKFANNICKLSRDRERAAHQRRLGTDDDVFDSPKELQDHHRL